MRENARATRGFSELVAQVRTRKLAFAAARALAPLFLAAVLASAEEPKGMAGMPAASAGEPGSTPGADAGPAGFSRSTIRLSPAQGQAIGVKFAVAERRSMEKIIRTVGRFDVDERRAAEVNLKVGGWIHELFADYTGRPVRKGEALFTIYSPDLLTAEQEYLLARQTEARLRQSSVPGAAESAQDLLLASRQRLKLWDFNDRQIRALEEGGKPSLYQTIYSPIGGVVLEKTVLRGSRVEPGAMLYKVADLSKLWVNADVYEYEIPFVRVGQEAEITLAYYPGQVLRARLSFVYPTLDAKTRTVKVRFELPNQGSPELRPEMYGNVLLRVPAGERLVVPSAAILDSGRKQVVFVDGGGGRLEPREVQAGDRFDDHREVREGLEAGERVVASATFLVDSESKLQAAESMMGMMGAIGMGDWKMESARPMDMGGDGAEEEAAAPPRERPPRAPAQPAEKRVGDLHVSVFPAAGDAKVGASPIRVRVLDSAGAPVADARVSFNYTMDMPGMTIEQAEAKSLGDGVYEGMASFTMGGPWSLVVEIARPGKPSLREKFTVRVGG